MKPDSPFRKAINAIEVWVSVFAMLLLILGRLHSGVLPLRAPGLPRLDGRAGPLPRHWSVLFDAVSPCAPTPTSSFPSFPTFPAPAWKKYVKCFSCIVCLAFSIIMVYAGMESVINIHWSEQLTPAMQLPAWIIWMAMPAGFGLMGIQAILRCVDEIAKNI